MKKSVLLSVAAAAVLFSGCAVSDSLSISKKPTDYAETLAAPSCDSKDFLADDLKKAQNGDDPIFVSINAASLARSCGKFELSNEFLELAVKNYKDDDQKGVFASAASTVGKTAMGMVLNDTFADYEGSQYERIMSRTYEALNSMSLNDYDRARSEIKGALNRQDFAKQYFKDEIKKLKEQKKKDMQKPEIKENMKNLSEVFKKYDSLATEFKAQEDFVNPYVTYLASVFYYMDGADAGDYKQAADLFREVAKANPKTFANVEKAFENKANKARDDGKKYLFLAYEDGLGTTKEEFALNIPYTINGNVATLNLAFPTLKKRDASYGKVSINGLEASEVANFDNILATEQQVELPKVVMKTILSAAAKSAGTAAVASNSTAFGSLAASAAVSATNKADIRTWQTLPKTASIAIVENTGVYSIKDASGKELAKGELDKTKNALIWVRSVDKNATAQVVVVEK